MPVITPHIIVGGAEEAANWYREGLGAEIGTKIQVPDGRFMQIELLFGDSQVMIADEFPELGAVSPLTVGGTYGALTIRVADADAAWSRAIEHGATEHHPLQNAFWGERHGQFIDPYGHRWGIAQRIEEVDSEELARRASSAFGAAA